MSKGKKTGKNKDKFEYKGFTIVHNHKIEDRKFVNHMVGLKSIKNQNREEEHIKIEAKGYSFEEAKKEIRKKIDSMEDSPN